MDGNSTLADGPTRRAFMGAATSIAAGAALSRATTSRPSGANERIGIGFIGCGGRADNHMAGMVAMRDKGERIELVAGCDVYRPRLTARSQRYKFKPYDTYQELLQDPRLDAVVIATPDHHHGYQAIDAIRAGKDVYCEKPVTHWRQFELTKRLAYEVRKSDRVFMLGTQWMSDAAWRPARQLIQEGAIGRPIHAECGYFRTGDWGERGMPIDDPNARPGPNLNWDAFLGDAPKRPFDVSRFFRWRMYIDYSGGTSTDLYPHLMTQVVYMLGVKLPSKVVATGGKFRYEEREVPDTFNLLIDYPERITLAVLGSQGNGYSGPGVYDGAPAPVIRGWDGSLTVQGDEIIVVKEDANKPGQRVRVESHVDQDRYYREWLDCIRMRKQPTSSAELAYHVQITLHMAMLSWRENKVATFDPQAEKIVLV